MATPIMRENLEIHVHIHVTTYGNQCRSCNVNSYGSWVAKNAVVTNGNAFTS